MTASILKDVRTVKPKQFVAYPILVLVSALVLRFIKSFDEYCILTFVHILKPVIFTISVLHCVTTVTKFQCYVVLKNIAGNIIIS